MKAIFIDTQTDLCLSTKLSSTTSTLDEQQPSENNFSRVIFIAVGACCAIITGIGAAGGVLFLRRRHKNNEAIPKEGAIESTKVANEEGLIGNTSTLPKTMSKALTESKHATAMPASNLIQNSASLSRIDSTPIPLKNGYESTVATGNLQFNTTQLPETILTRSLTGKPEITKRVLSTTKSNNRISSMNENSQALHLACVKPRGPAMPFTEFATHTLYDKTESPEAFRNLSAFKSNSNKQSQFRDHFDSTFWIPCVSGNLLPRVEWQ